MEKGRKKTTGREKVQMAWRHKSKGEKHLLMVIAFLLFALLCFIIAVISMNFAFKSKIRDLEDEIHDLKTETPISTTTLESTTTENLDTTLTTMTSAPTTTPPPTTTPSATTTTASTSTASSTRSSSASDGGDSSTISEIAPQLLLLDALRALLFNFSGMTSSMKSIDKTTHKGSITSRSHGTILIMADINHEESVTSMPELPESSIEEDPFVYIDTNGTSALPMNATTSLESASHFDDTEDDNERTADDILDLEGSGASEDTVNP